MTTTVRSTGRDYRDIIGGGVLLAFGLFCALYAQEHYKLGSPTRMGPGWFPMYLGYLLAILGALIMVPAFFRDGEPMDMQWRPMALITLGVLLFAAAVKTIGLAPAIALQVAVSVVADDKLGIRGTAILVACTATAAWLIFHVGLGLQLPAFIWPFEQ